MKNKWSYVKTKYLKNGVLYAVVTTEVIVHVIRKLTCAPNAGGSINQLRATHIKINLLVILKIEFLTIM